MICCSSDCGHCLWFYKKYKTQSPDSHRKSEYKIAKMNTDLVSNILSVSIPFDNSI